MKLPKCRNAENESGAKVVKIRAFICVKTCSVFPSGFASLALLIFPLFRLIKGGIEDLVAKDKGQRGGGGEERGVRGPPRPSTTGHPCVRLKFGS